MTKESTPRNGRKTVLMVGAVLAAMAGWQYYRGRTVFSTILAACAVCLWMVSAAPAAALRFHRAWMRLAEILGFINSRIILAVFYFGIMTTVGWVMRMLDRDPLSRRGPKRDTYWCPRAVARQTKESFERSF